ncbi:MAG: hypothetical protein IJ620_05875 [Bacteroidales bacterium]|nr:hypothetical protein [Bacteroidales bacterium]
MKKQEWFRREEWSDEIEQDFLKRLRKKVLKVNGYASQYVRIQAVTLLKKEPYVQTALHLFNILFTEFPNEYREVMHGHYFIGNYYFRIGDYAKAREQYDIVRKHNVSNKPELEETINMCIVDVIIETHLIEELDYAQWLMEEALSSHGLFLQTDVDRFNDLQKRLIDMRGKAMDDGSYKSSTQVMHPVSLEAIRRNVEFWEYRRRKYTAKQKQKSTH